MGQAGGLERAVAAAANLGCGAVRAAWWAGGFGAGLGRSVVPSRQIGRACPDRRRPNILHLALRGEARGNREPAFGKTGGSASVGFDPNTCHHLRKRSSTCGYGGLSTARRSADPPSL